jgi:hypothetical protein
MTFKYSDLAIAEINIHAILSLYYYGSATKKRGKIQSENKIVVKFVNVNK